MNCHRRNGWNTQLASTVHIEVIFVKYIIYLYIWFMRSVPFLQQKIPLLLRTIN